MAATRGRRGEALHGLALASRGPILEIGTYRERGVADRIVFHDFNDPRNDDPSSMEIKVRPAVESSWVSRDCELERVVGACGVFVRRRVPPAPRRMTADLSPLHEMRDLWRYRVRLPAGRAWRRRRLR
jgi:hypothetical protein